MAVTITVAALASAIRVGDSAEETAQVTRLARLCRRLHDLSGTWATNIR